LVAGERVVLGLVEVVVAELVEGEEAEEEVVAVVDSQC